MPHIAPSTQQFVPIAQIKQSTLILKNGGLRAILEVTPVNFALKNNQDQEALVGQYQTFLNSLEFPLQMVAQSRRLDVFPYLKNLAKYSENIKSDLLRIQIFDYVNFVQKLTELANIMEKRFFCVVPYEPRPIDNPSFIKKLFTSKPKISISSHQFVQYGKELNLRSQTVSSSLEAMGLTVKRLSTQEIIEEFYYIFNPEEAVEEKLQPLTEISAPVISAKNKVSDGAGSAAFFVPPKVMASSPKQTSGHSPSWNKNVPGLLKKPIPNQVHKLNPQAQPAAPNPKDKMPERPTPQKPASPQNTPVADAAQSKDKNNPTVSPEVQADAENILNVLNQK